MSATILIVDDARLNREVLKLAVAPAGYKILEAANGREAIDEVLAHDVDLILLDLMMPVMDGFEFLKWRRQNAPYSSIPVIVNSALDDFESIQTALDMDSYDYFTKPLQEQDLKVILPLKIKNAINAKKIYGELKERNERIEKEIELAAKYQRFLLPKALEIPGLDVATFYRPFIGVAGDFFDVVDLDDAAAFFIADVSGHGLLSAMISSLLKPLFERYISETRSPRQTFNRINQDLLKLTLEEDYSTAFCAYFDRRAQQLTYATAGHPAQLLWRSNERRVDSLRSEGFFLGMFATNDPLFQAAEEIVSVSAGDRLLIFTDGPIEARNAHKEQFGFERWRDGFEAAAELNLKSTTERLWQNLVQYTGGQFQDDIAFLIVQFGERE